MEYIEYLGLPLSAGIAIVALLLVANVVGAIMEVKNKTAPLFMSLWKCFTRRKQERQLLEESSKTLAEVKKLLNDVNAHYSADNIAQRDGWMTGVNEQLSDLKEWKTAFADKMDHNTKIVQEMQIEGMRKEVINFAAVVADENRPVSKEQFDQAFRAYDNYEAIIKAQNISNGMAEASIRIIREAYADRLHNRTFLENLKGYDIKD